MDDVRFSGPMFDGRADVALAEGITEVRRKVADRGAALTRAVFAGLIRDDHGRFLASVTTTSRSQAYSSQSGHKSYTMPVLVGQDEDIVTTSLATYGPWLEGTGSRNLTTRFKGHHGYRIAGQQLDMLAGAIGDEAIRPWVGRMS